MYIINLIFMTVIVNYKRVIVQIFILSFLHTH